MLKRIGLLGILITTIILLFGINYTAKSQFDNLSISAGLSTSDILFDNPASLPMVQRDTNKAQIDGGSFDGQQVGLGFRFNINLDKNGNFVIPIGLDYTFFRSRECVPYYYMVKFKFSHNVDVFTPTIGFNWSFLKFPIANCKAYIGTEFRFSFIQQGTFSRETVYEARDSSVFVEVKTKSSTFRLGGALKLGIIGEIIDPWYLNTSIGIGGVNIIGKDNSRGELLTPSRRNESVESALSLLLFNLMIQYRL